MRIPFLRGQSAILLLIFKKQFDERGYLSIPPHR